MRKFSRAAHHYRIRAFGENLCVRVRLPTPHSSLVREKAANQSPYLWQQSMMVRIMKEHRLDCPMVLYATNGCTTAAERTRCGTQAAGGRKASIEGIENKPSTVCEADRERTREGHSDQGRWRLRQGLLGSFGGRAYEQIPTLVATSPAASSHDDA